MRFGRRRSIGASAALLSVAGLVAGCGNSRTPAPDTSQPALPRGFIRLNWRSAGVSLRMPASWSVRSERAPLVAVIGSGPAIIAVWAHPRSAPVPAGSAALRRVRAALVAAAQRRDPGLELAVFSPVKRSLRLLAPSSA